MLSLHTCPCFSPSLRTINIYFEVPGRINLNSDPGSHIYVRTYYTLNRNSDPGSHIYHGMYVRIIRSRVLPPPLPGTTDRSCRFFILQNNQKDERTRNAGPADLLHTCAASACLRRWDDTRRQAGAIRYDTIRYTHIYTIRYNTVFMKYVTMRYDMIYIRYDIYTIRCDTIWYTYTIRNDIYISIYDTIWS